MENTVINKEYLEKLYSESNKDNINNIEFDCNQILRMLEYNARKGQRSYILTNDQKQFVFTNLDYVNDFFMKRDIVLETFTQYAFPGSTKVMLKNVHSVFYIVKF